MVGEEGPAQLDGQDVVRFVSRGGDLCAVRIVVEAVDEEEGIEQPDIEDTVDEHHRTLYEGDRDAVGDFEVEAVQGEDLLRKFERLVV